MFQPRGRAIGEERAPPQYFFQAHSRGRRAIVGRGQLRDELPERCRLRLYRFLAHAGCLPRGRKVVHLNHGFHYATKVKGTKQSGAAAHCGAKKEEHVRTYPEHLEAVRAACQPRTTHRVPLADAAGGILAAPLTAAVAQPPFDNSQMDGYALATCAGGEFTVGATIAAGDEPAPHPGGAIAVPIMTGAKVPAGTACIIPVEAGQPDHFPAAGEQVTLPSAPEGQFIRRAGSDAPVGALLLEEGTRLGPVAMAVLASQNVAEVEVVKPARILIVTGGAEIGAPGAASAPGTATIPDANGPLLTQAAAEAGIEVVARLSTNDDPAALAADLRAAIAEHQPDAVVTSGGISHGKFEVVRQVLDAAASNTSHKDNTGQKDNTCDNGAPSPGAPWFGHVAQQPGGPQGLSFFAGVPVISLPGNPISTLVSFLLYVAPILGNAPARLTAVADADMPGLAGKDQFLRGTLRAEGAQLIAAPVGGTSSHLLSQAAAANCLIRIPASAPAAAGSTVEVFPFPHALA